MAHDLYIVLVGILFGLANVIPGVSGGTIAVVFGVYEKLITIIADFWHQWKKELRFLITFAIGGGIGILVFGKLMDLLLKSHPDLGSSFFVGVILASIPMIAKKVFPRRVKPSLSSLLPGLITLALMLVMAFSGTGDQAATEATGSYLLIAVKMLLTGIIAAACMIIPGISGSFVMVLIGMYGIVIGAVGALNLAVLAPLAVGALIGLFGCAKLIRYLLAKHAVPTYSAILGFVIGSVFSVFPGFAAFFHVGPILAFLVGIACIVLCNHYSAE